MDRRVVLLVLLLAEAERLAAKAVLDGLSQVAPTRRVAVVDGQAQLRTLTPLSPAKHLAGVPLLSGQVAAAGLHSRLGHHLYGLQIQLELDDRGPEGYVVACIWGQAATRTTADLGDYAAIVALDCPVEIHHYFLRDSTGGVWARPAPAGSGISVGAWRGVDPDTVPAHVEATADGRFPPLAGAVRVDLSGGQEPKAATSPAEMGPVIVVDATGGGDFHSLVSAVAAASPGTAILVRPGVYRGTVLIDKALDITGQGDRDTIILSAEAGPVIEFTAAQGRIANLTLRQEGSGSGRVGAGVAMSRGRLDLTGCDITSETSVCVAVYGDAAPFVLGNNIHHGKTGGVMVHDQGGGEYRDNDIHHNGNTGVYLSSEAVGVLRDNDIHNNSGAGLAVLEGSPEISGNRIYANYVNGVFVAGGAGVFQDNDIHTNSGAGVEVVGRGAPKVSGNRIYANYVSGVSVSLGGAGVFQDNDIRGNYASGVSVYRKGAGVFLDNDIHGHTRAGVEAREGGAPLVTGNRILNNTWGVWVHDLGMGSYLGNDLRGNGGGAWSLDEPSSGLITRSENQE